MRRNPNNSNITKEFILSKVNQVKIFSVYLGIPEEIIENCIDTGQLILSPLRIDMHPTCGFRYDNRGKLKFKDFAGFVWGDCFDIAAQIISAAYNKEINIANKRDFMAVLKHIAFTFSPIIYGKETDPTIENTLENGRNIIKKSKPIIEFVTRIWNNDDVKYWKQYGVDIGWLNTHFIYAVDQYYINRKVNPEPKYFYNPYDPCYAYLLGRDKNGIQNIKLYFPKRDKHGTKFITNCNHLEGIYNLEREDYDWIIITKSTKDRISLEKQLWLMSSLYGGSEFKDKVGVINIPAENYKLSAAEYFWLYDKLKDKNPKKLICFMDNDRTGYSESIYLRDKYDMTPVCIPKIYKVKDFSELRAKYNANQCKEFIIQTFNKIKDYVRSSQSIGDSNKSNSMPF